MLKCQRKTIILSRNKRTNDLSKKRPRLQMLKKNEEVNCRVVELKECSKLQEISPISLTIITLTTSS